MPSRVYGWKRDAHDNRDRKFNLAAALAVATLPSKIDLRGICPPVYNQEQLGSCTANGSTFAFEFCQIKQGLPAVPSSRLFAYYNTRVIEGTVAYDSGAQIRDAIKAIVQWGDCPESEWPYDVSQFATQPPPTCYTDAAKHLAVAYESVPQDLDHLRGCLASGFPIVFGFTVYRSFESNAVAQTGMVPMPHWFERVMGGHAVAAVGYDDETELFIIRNSWGSGWGDEGYCYMPYDYLLSSEASDFWTIRAVA
jgi:C1A family cysteine protease